MKQMATPHTSYPPHWFCHTTSQPYPSPPSLPPHPSLPLHPSHTSPSPPHRPPHNFPPEE